MKKQSEKPTLRERYENIAKSEWFKKTHDGMSVSVEDDEPKWTEEDEHHWMMCLECVEECATQEREDFSKTIDWLKSLKKGRINYE